MVLPAGLEAIADFNVPILGLDGDDPADGGTEDIIYIVSTKPGSTDDIEGRQPFSQVRPPLSLPGGCTYQVQSSTAPIRALTCLNTDKPEKASVDRG